MPRKKKPPRLYYREDKDRWVIRDGEKQQFTASSGYSEEPPEAAQKELGQYIIDKVEIDHSESSPSKIFLSDVLISYWDEHAPTTARPKEIEYHINALSDYWADRKISEIRGETCRAYAKRRTSPQMARRELETMRAAVNWYHKEYGLDSVPAFTLPRKAKARERWLTRSEVAAMLWAARKTNNRHVARLIIVGIYTGTRSGAILGLTWLPNVNSGWVDLDKGVMHRMGSAEEETKKRRPPVRMPKRLIAHMRIWRENDEQAHVITWNGKRIQKLRRSWAAVREAAGLGPDVIPHSLRHTAATWQMQAGVDPWEAAGFLGMTVQQLEATYGHHHPDFQREAAEAY